MHFGRTLDAAQLGAIVLCPGGRFVLAHHPTQLPPLATLADLAAFPLIERDRHGDLERLHFPDRGAGELRFALRADLGVERDRFLTTGALSERSRIRRLRCARP